MIRVFMGVPFFLPKPPYLIIDTTIPDDSWAETVDGGCLTDGSRINSLINGLPPGLWPPHK